MKTHTVAVIQARMSSSRLPGKVMMPLGGKPAIRFMVDRLSRSRKIDQIIVATSDDPSDDPLAAALEENAVGFIRGSLNNVLARFHLAAEQTGATQIVRLTGDCPLIDPKVVDDVIALVEQGADYASNVNPPMFPDGLDAEAFTRDALDRAMSAPTLESDREHVTPWMRREENGLKQATLLGRVDLSKIRLTIDYPDDYDLVCEIVRRLGNNTQDADLFDILRAYATIPLDAKQAARERNATYCQSKT